MGRPRKLAMLAGLVDGYGKGIVQQLGSTSTQSLMELVFVGYRVWTLDFLIDTTCVALSNEDFVSTETLGSM